MLLAIDPSIRSCGWALFGINDRLFAADRVLIETSKKSCIAQRCSAMVDAVVAGVDKALQIREIDAIAFEVQQIYPTTKNPNDLIGMIGVGMGIGYCFPSAELHSYRPAEWTGQIPKTTGKNALKSPRAQRILSRLDEIERSLVPNQHDAIDAIGIGLHHLGRLKPVRVFAGAR